MKLPLAEASVRKDIEDKINKIAKGQLLKEDVLNTCINHFI